MAGILKVDKYQDFNGNDIMTSDGSGNLTLNNAALKMTPAFSAECTVGLSMSNATDTLMPYNSEIYDTDGAYDNTSGNYKFTVPSGQGGKYFFSASLYTFNNSVNNSILEINILLRKNGTTVAQTNLRPAQSGSSGSTFHAGSLTISKTLDLNVNDYVQVYANTWVNSSTPSISTSANFNHFQGYKIIGA